MRRFVATRLIGTVLVVACLTCIAAAAQEGQPRDSGIFLILDEAAAPDSLRAPSPDEYVAVYDYKFRDEASRPQPKYFLLRKQANVRLALAAAPKRVIGGDGRTTLGLELANGAAAEMERFTREHLGRSAAFVLDGEVITAHKIQSVIENGEFYVSRCTDNACEYILARLNSR